MTAYDVIGDVHGHFDKLAALLLKMGYTPKGDSFLPPSGRQAIFVGDLIDRGPEQVKVLKAVRAMVEAGNAKMVMGNHEFNAIGYVTRDEYKDTGEFLRANKFDHEKSIKNRSQHAQFLAQVGEGSPEHKQWISWFKTLPLYLHLGDIRVVHAWWDDALVRLVDEHYWDSTGECISELFLLNSYGQENSWKVARETLTTGIEHPLPSGAFVSDKEGHRHPNLRIAAWRHSAKLMRDIAIIPGGELSLVGDQTIPAHIPLAEVTGPPIFFGHYWFSGSPVLESPKVACLDWSAAAKGPLVAYRWDGEVELSNEKFVAAG
jgi:Calcineurin-like phosphoesterase